MSTATLNSTSSAKILPVKNPIFDDILSQFEVESGQTVRFDKRVTHFFDAEREFSSR